MKRLGFIIIIFLCVGCTGENKIELEEQEKKASLRIGYENYPSSYAQALLVQEIAERKGHSTEIALQNQTDMWKQLENGGINTYLTAWFPDIHAPQIMAIQNNIQDLGMNCNGSNTGLYVPSYTHIAYAFELNFYRHKFKKTIYVCEESSSSNKAAQALIEALGTDIKIKQIPYKSLDTLLTKARQNKEWIVLALWSPNSKINQYQLRRLNEIDFSFGKHYETHTLIHKSLQDEELLTLLDNYYIHQWELNSLLCELEIQSVGSSKDKIKGWLDKNSQVMERVDNTITTHHLEE